MSKAWMPMYWGDYLADTMHFSRADHGSYLLLIAYYWCNGGLPEDDESVRKIAKCDRRQWPDLRRTLMSKFSSTWKHKRIDAELAQAIERSDAARARAMQRWNANHNHNHNHKESKKEDTASAVSPTKYFFESGVIRLSEEDFKKWEGAFVRLDLRAELLSLTEWARDQPKWFFAVSGALAKRNRELKLRAKTDGTETDKERRKRESKEALDELRAFGEGRKHGDLGGTLVRLLPRTGTGGGPEDISSGSG